MKLETFFEKFELFADTPNAVVKMRELVLHWRCKGSWLSSIEDDQPQTVDSSNSDQQVGRSRSIEASSNKRIRYPVVYEEDRPSFAPPHGLGVRSTRWGILSRQPGFAF